MEASEVVSLAVSCTVALSGIAAAAVGARAARVGARLNSQAVVQGPLESARRSAQREAYGAALSTLYGYLEGIEPAVKAGNSLEDWANEALDGPDLVFDGQEAAEAAIRNAVSPWPSRLALTVVKLEGPAAVAEAAKSVEAGQEQLIDALGLAGKVFGEESPNPHYTTQPLGTCRQRHDDLISRVQNLTDVASAHLNAPVMN
ncbi:hypothetical protein [Streptomyces harbinensis]|uniref:hypothetical protein n=1 Tax=Streptomyces harbinensis TaxID=1176198 RepID=UPI0036751143